MRRGIFLSRSRVVARGKQGQVVRSFYGWVGPVVLDLCLLCMFVAMSQGMCVVCVCVEGRAWSA